MRQFLQDYFYYTSKERNGVLILCAILLAIGFLPHAFPLFVKSETVDFSGFEEKVALFNQTLARQQTPQSTYQQPKKALTQQPAAIVFAFNPNTASRADFVKLGLPEKTANTILNYRNKGGKFRKKEDFKKIYGLKSSDYERLAPFLVLEKTQKSHKKKVTTKPETPQFTLFKFDPNTCSKSDFVKLGLSEKTAITILNYRNKGGKFRKVEDFKKIYGLKPMDYERLAPYIELPQLAARNIPKGYDKTPSKPKINNLHKKLKIAINQADAATWKKLRGIGDGYANRIVKYRNLLGGYASIQQLKEVYGLPDSTFQNIRPHLVIKNTSIQQININTATAKELKKHPYLAWKHANAITKFRQQHGDFQSLDDLKKIKIISTTVFEKVKPYLTIQ